VDVHEDHVVRALLHALQRVTAVVGDIDEVAQPGQHGLPDALVHQVVLDQQHPQRRMHRNGSGA